MMSIRELQEQRSQKLQEMRALNTAAEAENRDFSDNEHSRFKELEGEASKLSARLSRAQRLQELERQSEARAIGGADPGFEDLTRDFSVARAIRVQMGEERGGREAEVSAELARRNGREFNGVGVPVECLLPERRAALTTGPGGNLVATNLRPDMMIRERQPAMAVQGLGATVLSGLSGDIEIPKETGTPEAAWIAEHTNAPSGEFDFGKIGLKPKTLALESEMSRRMILQSTPAIETIVRNTLAMKLAKGLDLAAITGAGGNAPVGILNHPDIDKTSITGRAWL